jgi:hypothetical protein
VDGEENARAEESVLTWVQILSCLFHEDKKEKFFNQTIMRHIRIVTKNASICVA